MNKGLDLIQRQQIETIDGHPTGNVHIGLTFEELAELEKELKALEVLKEKRVDVYKLFSCFEEGGLKRYNGYLDMLYLPECHLTKGQFNLLKGELEGADGKEVCKG